MSNENDIESALRTAFLAAIPGAVGKTEFENVAFDPKGLTRWYSFYYIPNEPSVATVGQGGQDAYSGLVRVHIHIPTGSGKKDIETEGAALRSHFTPGQRLHYDSANVIIKGCGRIPGGPEDNCYTFKFSIRWESRLTRA